MSTVLLVLRIICLLESMFIKCCVNRHYTSEERNCLCNLLLVCCQISQILHTILFSLGFRNFIYIRSADCIKSVSLLGHIYKGLAYTTLIC